MKKFWIISVLIILSACQVKEPAGFVINGEVKGIDDRVVFLQDRVQGHWINIDSTWVNDGSFSFTGIVEYPMLYYIRIPGTDSRFRIFVENSEMIVKADLQENNEFLVSGSVSHDILLEFDKMIMHHDENLSALNQKIIKQEVSGGFQSTEELKLEFEDAFERRWIAAKNFIDMHLDKTVGVYLATRNLIYSMDGEELSELIDSFDPSLKSTSYIKALDERAEKLLAVAEGKPVTGFSLPDPEGNMLSVDEFRGKYLLISFWASWCPYCREENPHLLGIYEKYRDLNFEILGVSLDRDKQAWLNGISEDGLLWPQVSDLKGWQNQAATIYAVAGIPSNVLIDPNGIIIGRNLEYDDLEKKLNELFNTPSI